MGQDQSNRNISQYAKGNVIFEERTKATKIGLLVKGRVVVEGTGIRDILYSGSFLGVQDIFCGNYLCTYKALDDTILFLFDTENVNDLYTVITDNSDYCGLVIASMCKQLDTLKSIYDTIYNSSVNAYNGILQYKQIYEKLAYDIKLEKDTITRVFGIKEPEVEKMSEVVSYYSEMNTFTLDSVRGFFSQGNYIVKHHMNTMGQLYREIFELNQKLISYLTTMIELMAGNTQESVFYKYADLALLAQNRGKQSDGVMKVIDKLIDNINEYQNVIEASSNKKITVNRQKMEEVYSKILSGSSEAITYEKSEEVLSDEEVLLQTSDSLNTILSYGHIEFELAAEFKENIMKFESLRDRLAIDDDTRALRHRITDQFYKIYEEVFLKAYNDVSHPLPVQLFLQYGYMDEKLLEKEQILELYNLSTHVEGGKFKVYTIYEWLRLVYEGKKQPSKNEYDQDYMEWLRTEMSAQRITQTEFNEKSNNQRSKLEYEIHNFFRCVNRITNGKITTFVPVLHRDMIVGSIERYAAGPHKVEAILQKIMDIDYSLFYREVAYVNREKKIEKEYIMAEVLPEFILVPTVGANGVMWQAIEERQKDTPARLVLPIFAEGNINDIILKICAKFRWEMCRTAQGSAWNNIKYKSLTSEYVDYIQFYRKNHDLSEEKKEKLKSQILKCSNRTGDVFAIDYEAWIKGESQGAIRLNRVARRILAMYCPFEKSIRERLAIQPMFTDSIQAYEIERQKKARDIANHYKSLQNKQIELTKELIESLEFYQNL